jgi:diguanylate cyclase (GGDEF)-like protein/putative nucleotidyltransferase with HDIG domain
MKSQRFSALSVGGRAYVTVITLAGAISVARSLYDLIEARLPWDWTILALLTLLSGSATVKLPSLPATISVSETFVFISVLLFGPAAGTLTVALDALVISFWSYKKGHPLYKIVFNLFALPLTIWLASHLFYYLADTAPLFTDTSNKGFTIRPLIGPLIVLAFSYFALNSWIITFAISLEKHLAPLRIWRDNFLWLSLNFFGGASAAAILVSYTQKVDYTYLALILPLIAILYFTFSTSMGRVADANEHLRQLNNLYMSTIETLAMAIDAKDQITHGHIRRVQTYAVGLAKKMGVADPKLIQAVEAAALLHDMGKLAVPEYILNKPGPLTPTEFDKMKLHASVGADILSAIEFPYPVVPIVRHHHENWDGTGYPDGLAGANIPIGARILSVVDCFDALTSDRPYRPRLSDKDAIRILIERRGSMYDPLVVDTFMAVYNDIAPAPPPIPEQVPLRAITEASITSAPVTPSSQRLEEIAASTEEMLTLFDLARGLNNQMSVQDAGDVIAKHLRRLVPSALSVFFLYESTADELVAVHASGEDASLVSGLKIGLGQRLSGWVGAHRQCIRNSDPVLDFGDSARSKPDRLRSCLSAPMIVGGSLVGVLSLYSTKADGFSEEHQRIIEVVSGQVSAIIKHAAEFERTKSLALRDQLTGLPNIDRLRQIPALELATDAPSIPVSILLIDVNGLENINRRYGRTQGDAVLGRVVRAIRRSLRAADMLFRYRDDEFLALLLSTDTRTSRSIEVRIHEAIRQEEREAGGPAFQVKIAVASAPDDGSSIDHLISHAEGQLTDTSDRVNSVPPRSIH